MCMGISPVHMSVPHVCLVTGAVKRGHHQISPELELQMAMCSHVDAGNRTYVLQDQQVLLTTKPSLQLQNNYF